MFRYKFRKSLTVNKQKQIKTFLGSLTEPSDAYPRIKGRRKLITYQHTLPETRTLLIFEVRLSGKCIILSLKRKVAQSFTRARL